MEQLIKDCAKGLQSESDGGYFEAGAPFEIPVLQDIDGKTAIDVALGIGNDIKLGSIYYRDDSVLEKKFSSSKLYRRCGRTIFARGSSFCRSFIKRVEKELNLK